MQAEEVQSPYLAGPRRPVPDLRVLELLSYLKKLPSKKYIQHILSREPSQAMEQIKTQY